MLVAGAAFFVVGCGDDDDPDSAGTAGRDGDEFTIEIVDFAFDDEALTVRVGAAVTFTNADDTAHTATARNQSFNTDSIGSGESVTVTVGEPGTYGYFCSFHPFMEGSITVE